MKKEKLSPNELSIKDREKENALRRDLFFLKPLLLGINNEKEISFKDAQMKIRDTDKSRFKGSVLIMSINECYRHISITALSKFYDRNTKYTLIATDTIINSWYSNDNSETVSTTNEMLKPDVLIIFGDDSFKRDTSKNTKRKVAIEIMSTRKSLNKDTWLFCRAADIDRVFDKSYGFEPYLDSIIDLDRIIEDYRNKEGNN